MVSAIRKRLRTVTWADVPSAGEAILVFDGLECRGFMSGFVSFWRKFNKILPTVKENCKENFYEHDVMRCKIKWFCYLLR